MPNIGISLKRNYYTPEAFAYRDYLESEGWSVQLDYEELLSPENEITILFLGFDPCWTKNKFKKVIHDFPSASTGAFPKIKNRIKRSVNRTPDGRIFFDDFVKQEYNFKDHTKSINISAGIDQLFFNKGALTKEYDLVYSGAISGRNGISIELNRLSNLGLKILIIGEVSKSFRDLFFSNKNVVFIGRVERDKLPDLYRLARAGLNFIPNAYPYHFQSSIKVLEYLATGIGLVECRRIWAQEFSEKNQYQPLWLEDLKTKDDFDCFEFSEVDMLAFSWDSILKNANFNNFVSSLLP